MGEQDGPLVQKAWGGLLSEFPEGAPKAWVLLPLPPQGPTWGFSGFASAFPGSLDVTFPPPELSVGTRMRGVWSRKVRIGLCDGEAHPAGPVLTEACTGYLRAELAGRHVVCAPLT